MATYSGGCMLGYQILKFCFPRELTQNETFFWSKNFDCSKTLEVLEKKLSPQIKKLVHQKTVIDFGCGFGEAAIAIAKSGAKKVYGIDIREYPLLCASELAATLEANCQFTMRADETADVVVSIDAFEHFDKPEKMLELMKNNLKNDGVICMSFGPTWYHPLGGHLFSVFPWAHLIFSEESLIRWRADFKTDGARFFGEVEGGLNQMTINRFEKIVKNSGLKIQSIDLVPIRPLKWLSRLPGTREFTTSLVRCVLVKDVVA